MRFTIPTLVVTAVLLASASASAQERTPAAQDYASCLSLAFDAYTGEVERAFGQTYGSEFEAEAVSRSLSTNRFEGLLNLALESRGLTRQGLANFLDANRDFARAQRVVHHGRLARLSNMARTLTQHVSETAVLVAWNDQPLTVASR